MNHRRENDRETIFQLVRVGVMTTILCVMAPISVPIGPVPISLGVFAVYIAAYVLGAKWGTVSYLLYLLLGLTGLPVFSGFTGGIGKLLGPTGGYLIGMIFTVAISGYFIDTYDSCRSLQIAGMALGAAINYAFGTTWLAIQANLTFAQALLAGVVPFIIADVLKLILALIVGDALRKRLPFLKHGA